MPDELRESREMDKMSNFLLHSRESNTLLLFFAGEKHPCNNFSRCYKTSFAIQSFLVAHQWNKSSKQAVKSV